MLLWKCPALGYFLILYHFHLLSGTWFYNALPPSETPFSFGFFEEGLSCSQDPFSSSPVFPFFATPPPWVPTEALSRVLLYIRSCQSHSSHVTSTQTTPKSAFLELPFALLTFKPTFNSLVEPPEPQSTTNLGNQQSGTSPGCGGNATYGSKLLCPWGSPSQESWSGLPFPSPGALHG